jgi:molecular chaperone IbpA
MNQLTRFDTSALNRALIGFDRLFDDVEKRLTNTVQPSYPPYNILKTSDNDYVIELAVTGFSRDEIQVDIDRDEITVKATGKEKGDTAMEYLHRGLAIRDFERKFTLAEFMEITSAKVTDGLLRIFITRVVPEALKPRSIQIESE